MINREFKFRAFSDKSGMWSWERLTQERGGHPLSCLHSGDGWHVMQYTGLKDNRGTEIFEGDIVRGSWSITLRPMVVVYQAPSFVMKTQLTAKTWSTFDMHHEDPQSYVVIGNIYENRGLLKGETGK